MIEITTIETTIAEENLAKIIMKKKLKDGEKKIDGKTEHRTIFLNGEWGTGKTEYLNRTEKQLAKGKFIFLKFWEQTDKRSPINIAFLKVHPFISYTSKFFVIFSVVVSILMTPAINLGLSRGLPDWLLSTFGMIALFVAVWKIFKYQSDDFYYLAFKKLPTKFIKKKILIIDDFDRIPAERQEDIYKMFNTLKGRLPILFVGNFQKISKFEGSYLFKIIDQRVDLPLALEPVNIWENYFKKISEEFNTDISEELKRLFVKEKRNLRDQVQFNMLVNQEFFERKKKGGVQVEQQMVIIYISLFHPDVLNRLRSRENNGRQSVSKEQTISEIITNLLEYNNDYPPCFKSNPESYFLYEFVFNLSTEEAEAIVNDDEKIEQEFTRDSINMDFYTYLQNNYYFIEEKRKEHIFNLTLKKVKEYQTNSLIQKVIQIRNSEIRASDEILNSFNNEQNSIKQWDSILEEKDFDISQKLFFFNRYLKIGFKSLSNYYTKLSITSNMYSLSKRKDFYFLTYLSQNSLFFKLDNWEESLWEVLDAMPEEQYLSVLSANNVLDNHMFLQFEAIPNEREYTVYKEQVDQNTGSTQDNSKVIEKHVAPKLTQLEKSGYIFNDAIEK